MDPLLCLIAASVGEAAKSLTGYEPGSALLSLQRFLPTHQVFGRMRGLTFDTDATLFYTLNSTFPPPEVVNWSGGSYIWWCTQNPGKGRDAQWRRW